MQTSERHTSEISGNSYRVSFSNDGFWRVRRNDRELLGCYSNHKQAFEAMDHQIVRDDCHALKARIIAGLDECGPATLRDILAMIEPS